MSKQRMCDVWAWQCKDCGVGTGGFDSWSEASDDARQHVECDNLRIYAVTPAAPPPAEQGEWKGCVTCGHGLTTKFCTAMGCMCPDHRGPTLASAEEWRETALELADEVKRLNELLATRTPQPAGEEPGYVTEHFAEIGRHAAARCNCPEMDGCYSQIRGLAKKGLQEMGAWGDSPVAQSSPASDARAEAHAEKFNEKFSDIGNGEFQHKATGWVVNTRPVIGAHQMALAQKLEAMLGTVAEAHAKCLDCGKARGGVCGACHCGDRP
jgi:hypothetical protein